MTTGERIKILRINMNYSQVEFADLINVSKQTLYKYENNIITNIPSDKIELMAEYCNTTPGFIMGWEEKSQPNKVMPSHDLIKAVESTYGKSTKDAFNLYIQLDPDDQGEIRGEMKQMLKAEKYSAKKSKHA